MCQSVVVCVSGWCFLFPIGPLGRNEKEIMSWSRAADEGSWSTGSRTNSRQSKPGPSKASDDDEGEDRKVSEFKEASGGARTESRAHKIRRSPAGHHLNRPPPLTSTVSQGLPPTEVPQIASSPRPSRSPTTEPGVELQEFGRTPITSHHSQHQQRQSGYPEANKQKSSAGLVGSIVAAFGKMTTSLLRSSPAAGTGSYGALPTLGNSTLLRASGLSYASSIDDRSDASSSVEEDEDTLQERDVSSNLHGSSYQADGTGSQYKSIRNRDGNLRDGAWTSSGSGVLNSSRFGSEAEDIYPVQVDDTEDELEHDGEVQDDNYDPIDNSP